MAKGAPNMKALAEELAALNRQLASIIEQQARTIAQMAGIRVAPLPPPTDSPESQTGTAIEQLKLVHEAQPFYRERPPASPIDGAVPEPAKPAEGK